MSELLRNTEHVFVISQTLTAWRCGAGGAQPRKREGRQAQVKSAFTPSSGRKCQAVIFTAAGSSVPVRPAISYLASTKH